jgi:hypothetical protein
VLLPKWQSLAGGSRLLRGERDDLTIDDDDTNLPV